MPFKYLLFFLFIFQHTAKAQITICTWNVQRIGKNTNQKKIEVIAQSLQQCDLIGLQEITLQPEAAKKLQAIRKSLSLLQQNKKWEVVLSKSTSSANAQEQERYAFIYNKEKLILNKHFLLTKYSNSVVREPHVGYFKYKNKQLTIINYHAVPKSKIPQSEIARLINFVQEQQGFIIWMGDFNCYPTDSVYQPLKKNGYNYAPIKQATTIRQQQCVDQGCYANAYDYIWYNASVNLKSSGHYSFLSLFNYDGNAARKISDHIPVYITIDI